MGDETAALGREELLARVRASVQASARAPLSSYDSRVLTEQTLELLRAALHDPEVREALAQQEGLRELLADEAARQRLQVALEERTVWERLREWYEREATLVDFGAVVVLVVAALVGVALLTFRGSSVPRTPGASRPVGTPLTPEHVAWLLSLPERQAVPAGIEIAARPDAVFAPGDPLLLRVTLRAPALVALLQDSEDGPGAQAWPGLGQPPALVPPPASGGPAIVPLSLRAPPSPRSYRLRLVVAPADLDMGALSPAAFPAAAARLSLTDLRYQVTRP